MDTPFLPQFNDYKTRNKWIKDHAQYWTIILRGPKSRQRDEAHTFDEAVALAKKFLQRTPNGRFLIYAVALNHDALAATVSSDGVKEHE